MSAKINFSCYKCTERKPGCHSYCERYKSDRAEHDRLTNNERKSLIVEDYDKCVQSNLRDELAVKNIRSNRYGRGKYGSK